MQVVAVCDCAAANASNDAIGLWFCTSVLDGFRANQRMCVSFFSFDHDEEQVKRDLKKRLNEPVPPTSIRFDVLMKRCEALGVRWDQYRVPDRTSASDWFSSLSNIDQQALACSFAAHGGSVLLRVGCLSHENVLGDSGPPTRVLPLKPRLVVVRAGAIVVASGGVLHDGVPCERDETCNR